MIYQGNGWEVRQGLWQKAFNGDVCDVVMTDPPYTKRTLVGYRSGNDYAKGVKGTKHKMNIPYAAWTRAMCREYCEWAVKSAKHWIVTFNDHIGARWLEEDLNDLGWYVFAPVVWVSIGGAPRMIGDGPSSRTEYIIIARPKRRLSKARTGHRDGHYIHHIVNSRDPDKIVTGSKPINLMRALVRDYTIVGDTIIDPFLGGGTTVLAAALEGRTGIGAELDPTRCAQAAKRIRECAGQLALPSPTAADIIRLRQAPLFEKTKTPKAATK